MLRFIRVWMSLNYFRGVRTGAPVLRQVRDDPGQPVPYPNPTE